MIPSAADFFRCTGQVKPTHIPDSRELGHQNGDQYAEDGQQIGTGVDVQPRVESLRSPQHHEKRG